MAVLAEKWKEQQRLSGLSDEIDRLGRARHASEAVDAEGALHPLEIARGSLHRLAHYTLLSAAEQAALERRREQQRADDDAAASAAEQL